MKKSAALIAAVLLILSICAGCSSQRAEDNAKAFLTEFYTLTDPQNAVKGLTIMDSHEKAETYVELYKDKFQSYFTEDEFLHFLTSPDWVVTYSKAAHQGLVCEPSEIELEETDSGSYVFSLTLTVTDSKENTESELKQSGELTFDKSDKISDFRFDNLNEI